MGCVGSDVAMRALCVCLRLNKKLPEFPLDSGSFVVDMVG
jgi:hypothetical protein